MQTPKRLTQLDFTVPGIKTVGMELIRLVNQPEPSMTRIVEAAELDPAVFGTIIACANSALHSGITPIGDLHQAATRLGLREIRRIVFHVVLESAFRSDKPHVNKLLQSLWHQNLVVALLMQRLLPECEKVRALPLEMISAVYPLGLMHVIGIPVLITNYYDRFSLFVRDDITRPLPDIYHREQELFDGFDHFQLGEELLDRWGFPTFFSRVVGTYHQATPSLPAATHVLHDLLRLARHIADDMGHAALATAPAGYWMQDNTLSLNEDVLPAITRDVTEQLQGVLSFFS